MNDKTSVDQHDQIVNGPQTNAAGDINGPIFSGKFQGPFIYKAAAKLRLPLQKPPRVQHFTGREEELASLLKDLQPGRAVTICGPGGMGKTALAAEAIWQLAPGNEPPQRFPDGIIFHTFYHKPQATLALEVIARTYGEDPRPNPLDAASRALAGRQALIVLDGTEACDDIEAVLSVTASCGVLITTRRHSDAPADFSDLPPLPPDKAIQLLQAWGGELASDEKICQRICSLLGELPLAIFLVGRYMSHRRQLSDDYLAWLEKTPLAALNLGERQHRSLSLLMEHSLAQVSDLARDSLGISGALALKPFESRIIAIALGISPLEVNLGIGELVDYGMLLRPDDRYQVTHALIHTYSRERLAPKRDVLIRIAEHYNNFVREQSALGLAGYQCLDEHRAHILSVQFACLDSEAWKAVRTLTWEMKDYLDLQGHWADRVKVLETGLEAARRDGDRYYEATFTVLLGQTYNESGENQEAIRLCDEALAIYRVIGDRQGESVALGSLGLVYNNFSEYLKSIEYYEQQLAIAKCIADCQGEGITLCNLGVSYNFLGEYLHAIELFKQALEIARKIGNRRNEGCNYLNLGIAYSNLGEYQQSISHYHEALAIAQEIGDLRGEGRALGNIGRTYRNLGEIQRAIKYYKKQLILSREIKDRCGESAALNNLGNAYGDLGEFNRAIELYEQHLEISRNIGDRQGESNVLGNLGCTYAALNEKARAIQYFEQALPIADEIGDRKGKSNILNNLGLNCYSLGEYLEAIKFCEEALRIALEIGDKNRESSILDNLGLVYFSQSETRKAIEFYEKGLSITREIGYRACQGSILGHIGQAFYSLGETQKAIKYYEQAIMIHREIGDCLGEGTNLWNQCQALESLDQHEHAIKSAQLALCCFDRINSPLAETLRKKLAEWQGVDSQK